MENKIAITFLFCFLFLGCQKQATDTGLESVDATIIQRLDDNSYEEFLFEAKYLNGLKIHFKERLGTIEHKESTPSVGIRIKGKDKDQWFAVEYQTKESILYAMVQMNGEGWFDENLHNSLDTNELELLINGQEIEVFAKDFHYAMNIPFEASHVAIRHASIDVETQVDFYYK